MQFLFSELYTKVVKHTRCKRQKIGIGFSKAFKLSLYVGVVFKGLV